MELRTPLRNNGMRPWLIGIVLVVSLIIYFTDAGIIYTLLLIIFSALLVLFRLYETFTTVVRIHNDQLEIEYILLFKKKLICIPLAAATLSLKGKRADGPIGDNSSRRSYKNVYSLHIYEKGKKRHRISEDEGYSKADFVAFIYEFSVATQRLA